MEDLHHTAIHEAGHAVASIRLFPNGHGDTLTIQLDPDAGTTGHFRAEDVSFAEISVPEEEAETRFLNHAVYCCAGYGAVLAATQDIRSAETGCEPDFEESGRFLDEGKAKAAELMSRPENVQAVKYLADELLSFGALDWEQVVVAVSVPDGEATEQEYRDFLSIRKIMAS